MDKIALYQQTYNGTGLPYRSSVCTFTPDPVPVPDAGLNTALSPVVRIFTMNTMFYLCTQIYVYCVCTHTDK